MIVEFKRLDGSTFRRRLAFWSTPTVGLGIQMDGKTWFIQDIEHDYRRLFPFGPYRDVWLPKAVEMTERKW